MASDLLGKWMWNTVSRVEMPTQLNAATTRLRHEGAWWFRWGGGGGAILITATMTHSPKTIRDKNGAKRLI